MTSRKRATRKAIRIIRGMRNPDLGTTQLDAAFGIFSPIMLVTAGIGIVDFPDGERQRRRAVDKRARASRRRNRGS